ncbi:Ribonuclease H2 subunit A [Cytospora mali]|uniref:Ribonuclease n=1 Tax=Cytospora mali TaxID=578113 RepID=A0A194VU39_CYTMA|nr:Ribonuclease H2 subunit A [Valsa mali]
MEDTPVADPDTALETPAPDVFIPPSVHPTPLLAGDSYTHFSPVPPALQSPTSEPADGTPCCLGVDEAGRGPVLGPMVYGVFYLPLELSDPLLRGAHHFDDSKVLTPAVRSDLMEKLCTPVSPPADDDNKDKNNNNNNKNKNEPDKLHSHCGWATTALSARDISANMLKPSAAYNLNMQAMDATIALVQGVLARGVNVRDIYVDTIGQPAAYQKKLERVFPSVRITVAKKADSLYPCVSAASVCAKVTRDAALEVLHSRHVLRVDGQGGSAGMAWGSGYPSDPRCVSWMKGNMHPVFGWGPECRFSWGTAKDMIEGKGSGVKVEWPVEEDGDTARLTDFFSASGEQEKDADELGTWFGTPAGLEAF